MPSLFCKLEEPYFEAAPLIDQGFNIWFVEGLHEKGVSIVERNRAWDEALEWCEARFGPREERWYGVVSDVVRNYFCFVNEDDAFAFRMRWC